MTDETTFRFLSFRSGSKWLLEWSFLPTKCFIYSKEIGHLATMIKSKAEQAISSVGFDISQCLFTSKTQITIF